MNNNITPMEKNMVKYQDECMHAACIKFECTSCETGLCDDCLIPDHLKCHVRPKKSYIKKLVKESGKENLRYFKQLILEAKAKEEYFLSETARIRCAIEERTEKLKLFLDARKEALLNRVSKIEEVKSHLWETQRMDCENVINEIYKWDISDLKTFFKLGHIVNTLTVEAKKRTYSYGADIFFKPEMCDKMKIGKVKLLPCARNTSVSVEGKAIANTYNTCIVSVKNVLNELVEDDVDYKLDITFIDENEKSLYFIVRNLRNGQFLIKFYPTRSGTYTLFISLDFQPVIDSPKDVRVVDGSDGGVVQPVLVFGESGKEDGEFARPWGVCCDAYGRILVSDRCNHRIQVFTEDGHFHSKFGTQGSGPGEFNRPAGIVVDKFSRIIVADKDNHRIQIFDSDGMYITQFGKSEDEERSLRYPWDVAVNSDCNIAVTESVRQRVSLFSDSGIILRTFHFSLELELETPRGITCIPDGSFVVTDHNRHKLIKLDKNLENPKVTGSGGSEAHEFLRPQCVAADGNGTLAVTDCKNHRIKVFKENVLLQIFGCHGEDCGEFDAPQGIAFHPRGRIVVVDYGNSRIQVFDVDHI